MNNDFVVIIGSGNFFMGFNGLPKNEYPDALKFKTLEDAKTEANKHHDSYQIVKNYGLSDETTVCYKE